MSLNGLDAPAIAQIATSVQRDSAGWFLLKYATRDEIELYGNGTGGLAEAVAKIAAYEEKSPLYGIVIHVGKKALIRFVPTGTSRLLQARVKVHFDAISTQFPHDMELHISSSGELTDEALSAASPSAAAAPLPLSPALSLSNPGFSLDHTLERNPSKAGSSSAYGSSVNGDVAVRSDDGSDTPSSRTARLLAEVRAGKLESHEVLAALKITSTRHSDRSPSDNSLERPERGILARSEETETKRTGSEASLEPQLAQFPSPRPSVGSGSDLYRSKVKIGPRPSQSADPSVPTNVASLPAGISMPKPPTPVPSQSPPPILLDDFAASPTAGTHDGAEHNSRPIVQAPASVMSATQLSKAGSTTATVMTMPATLGQRKESASGQQSPREQQAVEKMRLMKALEMQRRKHAKHTAGDEPLSPDPLHSLPGTPGFPPSTAQAAMDAAIEKSHANGSHLPQIDIGATQRLHAATKSSPTLGSMVNFPLRVPEDVISTVEHIQEQRSGEGDATIKSVGKSSPSFTSTAADDSTQLPDLTASGPATLQLASADIASKAPGPVASESSSSRALDDTGEVRSTQTPVLAIETASKETKAASRILTPIDTNRKPDDSPEENQRTPVAAEPGAEQVFPASSQPVKRESVNPQISRMHSNHVSISTSISGASSFLEELESSNMEQAQPMTMMRSPITPTYPRGSDSPMGPPFAPVESRLKEVENSSRVAENPAEIGTSQATEASKSETARDDFTERATEIEDGTQRSVISKDNQDNISSSPVIKGSTLPKESTRDSGETPSGTVTAITDPVIEPMMPKLNDADQGPQELRPTAVEPASEVEQQKEATHDSIQAPVPLHVSNPASFYPGVQTDDPMKAIIEAEMGNTPKPLDAGTPVVADTPTELASPEDEISELAIPKGGSPGTKKHPTVQPPQIWGGALRSASNPSGEPPRHLSPVPDLSKMTRSASVASNSSTMFRPDPPSGIKKTGVGSRIADRIKALEKSSSGPSSSSAPVYAGSAVSVSSRKSSFHTPPGSSGTDSRRMGASSSPNNNIFTRRFGTVHGAGSGDSNRSDRTIRPGSSTSPESSRDQAPLSRPAYLRHKSSDSQTQNFSLPPSRDGSSSIASQQKTKSSFSSWTGRRDSAETSRTGHSRQSSVESTGTNSDKKKENKAKKLMKRVSGAFSPRKGRASPSFGEPIMESPEPDPPSTSASEYGKISRPATKDETATAMASKPALRTVPKPSNNVVVGEINVQFPDTLLWKRRHVELDGDGYIILAASTLEKTSRVALKKFHMSEFRQPYVPDQEREELPYSIILDFEDSSTLQCACQNGVDQKNVLQALLQFYAKHARSRA